MRHHNANRKFGLKRNPRRALIKSLANALIQKGKMKTTLAKAKEIRPIVEKMVTKAKDNTLASRRLLISRLGNEKSAKILVEKLGVEYKTRKGGYTRIVKLPRRQNDASPMALIEFVK